MILRDGNSCSGGVLIHSSLSAGISSEISGMSLYRKLFVISGVRGQLMVRQAACRRRLSPEARLNEWKLFRANGAKEQGERKECEERVKVSRVLNAVLDSPSGPPCLLPPPPRSPACCRPSVLAGSA